jgi:hypothetical protein
VDTIVPGDDEKGVFGKLETRTVSTGGEVWVDWQCVYVAWDVSPFSQDLLPDPAGEGHPPASTGAGQCPSRHFRRCWLAEWRRMLAALRNRPIPAMLRQGRRERCRWAGARGLPTPGALGWALIPTTAGAPSGHPVSECAWQLVVPASVVQCRYPKGSARVLGTSCRLKQLRWWVGEEGQDDGKEENQCPGPRNRTTGTASFLGPSSCCPADRCRYANRETKRRFVACPRRARGWVGLGLIVDACMQMLERRRPLDSCPRAPSFHCQ